MKAWSHFLSSSSCCCCCVASRTRTSPEERRQGRKCRTRGEVLSEESGSGREETGEGSRRMGSGGGAMGGGQRGRAGRLAVEAVLERREEGVDLLVAGAVLATGAAAARRDGRVDASAPTRGLHFASRAARGQYRSPWK